jgi:hypothetical protein
MRMMAMLFGILFVGAAPTISFSQQYPIEGCNIRKERTGTSDLSVETWVSCNVVENAIRVNNIILNRGNCLSPIESEKSLIKDMERDIRGRRPDNPFATEIAFRMCAFQSIFGGQGLNEDKRVCYEERKRLMLSERVFNFGDKIEFNIGALGSESCNLLEANFLTNKGNFSFKWR